MDADDKIKLLLQEIRENQRESMRLRQEHLDIARQQLERSNAQIEESIALQREAVSKARMIGRIAIPGVVLCLALIVYLVIRYF